MTDAAFRVYVCALSWCAQIPEPTGHLTMAQARTLAAGLGKRPAVIAELVRLDAWEAVDDGYLIHDYDLYLEKGSRDRVRAFRARKRSGNVTGNGSVAPEPVTETPEVTTPEVTVTPLARDGYPVPEPVPVVTPPAPTSQAPPPAEPERADVLELCTAMADSVEERGEKRPRITAEWRKQARLLLDSDHRPLAEAVELIAWAAHDQFWSPNVLSIPKFREQYPKLRLQRDRAGPPQNGTGDEDWRQLSEKARSYPDVAG